MSGRLVEWHTLRVAHNKSSSSVSIGTAIGNANATHRGTIRQTTKQRQRSKLYNLTLDISALQQQIHDLTQHRALLYTRALYTKFDADGSLIQKSLVFHDLFRLEQSVAQAHTRDGIAAVVDEDVTFGAHRGRDQYITSCTAFRSLLVATASTLVCTPVVTCIAEDDTCTVRIESITSGTLTMDAIHALYPAVLKDTVLTEKLRGMAVDLTIVTFATFGSHGRITRFDVEIDFVGLLVRLVADVVRAGELIEQAARDKQGVLYLAAEFDKCEVGTERHRVEELWGLASADPLPEGIDVDTRHTIEFLLA